ncbi:MAG: hypothetical protein AB8B57_07445 [Congregibacter sp.]
MATLRWLLLFTSALLAGCAVDFPRPVTGVGMVNPESVDADADLSGDELFSLTFTAHGGAQLAKLEDLNVALDGRWKFLITRIQPLVTDHRYRVQSEERISPVQGVYAARYEGPAGTKQVFRGPGKIRVWYDGVETEDPDVLASTALTADSFQLFSLGPLSPIARGDSAAGGLSDEFGYIRLPDVEEAGRRYHRIYRRLVPGLGLSESDELVLWIDAETHRTFRVDITLEGYRTTQGAHVDVTFLSFVERAGILLPVAFNERVRGPIAISAHRWWLTGLDLNRGWQAEALNTAPWAAIAAHAAETLSID